MTKPTLTRSVQRGPQGDRLALLGVYLNDHLAGATFGTELARRLARSPVDAATGETLRALAAEITADRAALLRIMRELGIRARGYKAGAGWAAEKIGRLKSNRRLLSRSPLSPLLELEVLRLGVAGKAAGWRTLRELAETDGRLDAARLDGLLERADGQVETLERLRVEQAARSFRTT
ncbi:hypothetical protein C3486_21685 [Streptomyces sp. Ru73]|uniref:hypothetical protein n=1 Tax=Streptomyces sp. Ru73 TaxID=2080748 RepID=UPI000CDDEA46|nr:hypothetical protein [Streptomyces sp. Ru73]POX38714.1 hypothetical protein C3486_21685 [Streptomyces sp. Ru73]